MIFHETYIFKTDLQIYLGDSLKIKSNLLI